jgi:hypothetical protein
MVVERSAEQRYRPTKPHEIAATGIELARELLATIHHVAERIVLRVSLDAGCRSECGERSHRIA